MYKDSEKKYLVILVVVLLVIIFILTFLVVDLDAKNKEIPIVKVTTEVDKTKELEDKINTYINESEPTELESKYGIKRKAEVSNISDNVFEVYIAYYKNGLKKLDFRSYYGETDSILNTEFKDYLNKDRFSLRVFKDISTDDEYYLIGDGDYKPDRDSYYIYDNSFNRLFQLPISTSGIFKKNNKVIDMVEIKDNKIYSLSYGKITKDIEDDYLYKYETYIEDGKINMNVIEKNKISDYSYENIVN